jgi:cysteine desulfurase
VNRSGHETDVNRSGHETDVKRIYLDYASTTPLDPEVELAMRPYQFMQGNPSSVHANGQSTREALEDARERLAHAIGASGRELIFTSGGTEADNQAVFAFGLAKGGHIITSTIEHSAVLAPARALAAMKRCQVTYLEPDEYGLIEPNQVLEAIRPDTVLVSIMHVNNEVGTIQDVQEIAEICRARGIAFHVDAVQSLGTVELNATKIGCDLLTISSHKFYGPKGIGALFVRRGFELPPLLYGGHQEGGLRGGTHNLPGAVGMALAAEKAGLEQPEESKRLEVLRDYFQTQLLEFAGVSINGHPTQRSPKIVNVTASGADGEGLLMNLDIEGVSASSGSACNAGTLEPSHVLTAMGRSRADARASIRFSFGRNTDSDLLGFAVQAFSKALSRSR